jgi:hypothetical protein
MRAGLVVLLMDGCSAVQFDHLEQAQTISQINWPVPLAIPYGTGLSGTQLNATASVPGSFSYEPALNSVLHAGAQTLSATFTPTDLVDFTTATAKVVLVVNPVLPVLNWPSPAAIPYGSPLTKNQLDATASYAGSFAYDPSPGTVLKAGEHTLSAKFVPFDSVDFLPAQITTPIEVSQTTPHLNWAAPAAIPYGTALSSVQLDAVANVPGSLTYQPAPGTLLGVGSQTLSATFTPADLADFAAVTAKVVLIVHPASSVLSWPAPAPISFGSPLTKNQLDATASSPGSLVYDPSPGTVLAAGVHSLSVKFIPSDSADFQPAQMTTSITVNRTTALLSWATPAAISYGTPVSAMQLDASANVPGHLTYTPALGTLFHAGWQTLSVTFTPADTADFTAATAKVVLVVNPVLPALLWAVPATISYGTPLSATQLDATANLPGSVAYDPSPGTVLTAGVHALSVKFVPFDSVDFLPAQMTTQITVNRVTPLLSWATPAAITYGTPLSSVQLDAVANVPGSLIYQPAPATLLRAGSQSLSVTLSPADAIDYFDVSATVSIAVMRATPVLIWTPAEMIAVHVPIGEAQLNATAVSSGAASGVTGTFAYSPAAGTTFNTAGPQTLSVSFAPSDAEDYNPSGAAITVPVSAFGIACWGDSQTFGQYGRFDRGKYPADLQQAIVLPVENLGVPGQTSTQIGVREGGVKTTVTVVGGIIPGSGGVDVNFPAGFEPINLSGPSGGVSGTILGVHGVVTLIGGTFVFTPTPGGSALSAPGNPEFTVDTPYAGFLPVFWEGQNNHGYPAKILSDLAGQVALVEPGQSYLVLPLINYNTKSYWLGGGDYKEIVHFNAELANTYAEHFIDTRALLVAGYDPTLITDVSDYQHDDVPTSLRAVMNIGSLANSIGPTDDTIVVDLGHPSSAQDILTIDSGWNAENVQITAVSGSILTVVRNFGGLNTAHSAGAPLVETDYIHLNAKGYQIVANAVAQALSAFRAQPSSAP